MEEHEINIKVSSLLILYTNGKHIEEEIRETNDSQQPQQYFRI